jgi:hypothetical protein
MRLAMRSIGRRATLCLMLAPLIAGTRSALALEQIKIRDLYVRGDFSEQALALAEQRIEVPGFMAPPVKPDADFFVLTRRPMAVCPFCDNEADWTSDIVLVKLDGEQDWIAFNRPIVVTGVLELGTEIDPETGFVSRVRLREAVYAPV